ncbi:HD domain-containing protein [Lachnoclostridium phytofermentans]|uniref:HD domain-containing protein n=1 Tax=Lachnoclostridium phytofermentans TaxID=66219 RepID=UPI0004955EAA|nr:HD domain-containing protein [Lachnoclostridium phytofermentans]
MVTENIKHTISFLKDKFLIDSEDKKFQYRYEHTQRVAAIGQQIAVKEGMNEEALVIGCLLHDIGYIECSTEEDYDLHGRISARIAREFLESIQYDEDWIQTICYGIYIHTEEKPQKDPTPFESSIADADNIDRFDAYRLYENLKYSAIEKMQQEEIATLSLKRIARLDELRDYYFGTETGREMWMDKLAFQKAYYERLLSQMELTLF